MERGFVFSVFCGGVGFCFVLFCFLSKNHHQEPQQKMNHIYCHVLKDKDTILYRRLSRKPQQCSGQKDGEIYILHMKPKAEPWLP